MTNARFAPDGKTVIFSAAPTGNRNELFIKDAQSAQARSLSLPDTRLLAVSSKGELAVLTQAQFLYQRIYLGTLSRMPIGEASPRELLKDVHDADWSPDGSELAIVRRVDGKDRLEYPASKILATSSGYFSDVRVSPDGSRLAFMRHPVDADDRGDVEIIDRSGRLVAKSPDYSGEEGLAWSPDGKQVLFSSAGNEGTDLKVRALEPRGPPADRSRELGEPHDLRCRAGRPDPRLRGHDARLRDRRRRRKPRARFLPVYDYSTVGGVSRDGKTVLLSDDTAAAGPYYSTYLRKMDASTSVRLGEGNPLDLSSDGKSVLAAVFTNPPRLMIYPTGAGEARNISFKGFESYETGQFFHGDERILLCGVRSGEGRRCYVAETKGGNPGPVTPEGTWDGKISPDERSVVAFGSGNHRIYPVGGGPVRAVPGLTPDDNVSGWSADGRSLIVSRTTLVPTRVERVDIATGKRTLLREVGPADAAGVAVVSNVLLSADEKSYAYTALHQGAYLFTVDGLR